jgi:hypothetical protein
MINPAIIIELAGNGKPPSPVENLDVVFVARPGCGVMSKTHNSRFWKIRLWVYASLLPGRLFRRR